MQVRSLVFDVCNPSRRGVVTDIMKDGQIEVEWLVTEREEGRIRLRARIKEVVSPHDIDVIPRIFESYV